MEITKSQLEKIYNDNTNKEACRILGITVPTLIRLLRVEKIPRKLKPRIKIIEG